MGAGHDHGAGGLDAPDHRRRLAVAFGITATILAAQAVGAVLTGSLALLTDTAHMLTDAVGLAVALVAASLALRPATKHRTWGFRRVEVLAALAQAALLLAVGAYAAVEGVRRLLEPPEVPSSELLVFGIVGLVGNLVAIAVLASGRRANLNLRAAFLEVVNDALGSVGVIVAAVVIATTGYQRADAIAGLLIAVLIVPRAFRLLREATAVLMEFTPEGLDLDDVRRHILSSTTSRTSTTCTRRRSRPGSRPSRRTWSWTTRASGTGTRWRSSSGCARAWRTTSRSPSSTRPSSSRRRPCATARPTATPEGAVGPSRDARPDTRGRAAVGRDARTRLVA